MNTKIVTRLLSCLLLIWTVHAQPTSKTWYIQKDALSGIFESSEFSILNVNQTLVYRLESAPTILYRAWRIDVPNNETVGWIKQMWTVWLKQYMYEMNGIKGTLERRLNFLNVEYRGDWNGMSYRLSGDYTSMSWEWWSGEDILASCVRELKETGLKKTWRLDIFEKGLTFSDVIYLAGFSALIQEFD